MNILVKEHYFKIIMSAMLICIVSACATSNEKSEVYRGLADNLKILQADPQVNQFAPVALKEAEEAVASFAELEAKGASTKAIDHQQYIVERKLEIAAATAIRNYSDQEIKDAELRRKDILIEAKESQAVEATAEAIRMANLAKNAEQRARQAEDRVEELEQSVEKMNSEASKLASTLKAVTVNESERGLVLTMGSILFELNKSALHPTANETLGKIAEFLKQYPNRNILVEGFTDSSGEATYNLRLSQDRASSVASSLKQHGIEADRISITGYGESFPVADNSDRDGRMRNRRVELIVAKEMGVTVPERAQSSTDGVSEPQ